jgi:hypothetical protein
MLKKYLLSLAALVAFSTLMVAAQGSTWTGVVSDSHCGAKHSMASDAAATCVAKCVEGGAKYVLVSGDKVYQLMPQDKFSDFAGKSVKVAGTEKDGAITVTSVEAAEQPPAQ